MKKTYKKAMVRIWCMLLVSAAICMGCGPKYEPIPIDGGPGSQATKGRTAAENGVEGKRKEAWTEAAVEAEGKKQAEPSADDSQAVAASGSMGETQEIETDALWEETIESPGAEGAAVTGDAAFYQQCGMPIEEADRGRLGLIEDVMNENKEAVAARIVYPRVVTVASGTFEVQDAQEFMAYYDEIFTEAFKMELDKQAEQELFCRDGMISFGTGLIWFFPSSNGSGMEISAINGLGGNSLRYGGT